VTARMRGGRIRRRPYSNAAAVSTSQSFPASSAWRGRTMFRSRCGLPSARNASSASTGAAMPTRLPLATSAVARSNTPRLRSRCSAAMPVSRMNRLIQIGAGPPCLAFVARARPNGSPARAPFARPSLSRAKSNFWRGNGEFLWPLESWNWPLGYFFERNSSPASISPPPVRQTEKSVAEVGAEQR